MSTPLDHASPTPYGDFLTRVIDDGIAAARRDYAGDADARRLKREGAILGFENCRGLQPEELLALLTEANERATRAHRNEDGYYWYWRCRALQIEWTCNVVSAALLNEGKPTIVPPTARGMMKAAEILGVANAAR